MKMPEVLACAATRANLKTPGSVEGASHKRPHVVRFHLREMSRTDNSTDRKVVVGGGGVGGKEGTEEWAQGLLRG